MMGKQATQEAKLFYYDICLERRKNKKLLNTTDSSDLAGAGYGDSESRTS